MARWLLATMAAAVFAACAGRGKPVEAPVAVAPAPVAVSDAGDSARTRTPDAGGDNAAAQGLWPPGDRDEPTYGELMRGERSGHGPVAQAEMRRWLRPLMSLDTSGCPSVEDTAAFYDCWCRLLCGVRFEARPETVQIRYPYAEVDGPGFEAAPDGHVTSCWHSGLGARETRVTCATR